MEKDVPCRSRFPLRGSKRRCRRIRNPTDEQRFGGGHNSETKQTRDHGGKGAGRILSFSARDSRRRFGVEDLFGAVLDIC